MEEYRILIVKKRKSSQLIVYTTEVIYMTEKEIQFEQRLNDLILLKALLIAAGEFDAAEKQEYDKQLDLTFELIT